MRYPESEKEVVIARLLEAGFTQNSRRQYESNFATVSIFPAKADYKKPTFSMIVRNSLTHKTDDGSDDSYSSEAFTALAIEEAKCNGIILDKRVEFCNAMKAEFAEHRVEVEWDLVRHACRTVKFYLAHTETRLFHLLWCGDFYRVSRLQECDDERGGEVDLEVTCFEDIRKCVKDAFNPDTALFGQSNTLSTIRQPAQWLHYMIEYGLQRVLTQKVETRRESDDPVVNALLPEDMETVTLCTLVFHDDVPAYVRPVVKNCTDELEEDVEPQRKGSLRYTHVG